MEVIFRDFDSWIQYIVSLILLACCSSFTKYLLSIKLALISFYFKHLVREPKVECLLGTSWAPRCVMHLFPIFFCNFQLNLIVSYYYTPSLNCSSLVSHADDSALPELLHFLLSSLIYSQTSISAFLLFWCFKWAWSQLMMQVNSQPKWRLFFSFEQWVIH